MRASGAHGIGSERGGGGEMIFHYDQGSKVEARKKLKHDKPGQARTSPTQDTRHSRRWPGVAGRSWRAGDTADRGRAGLPRMMCCLPIRQPACGMPAGAALSDRRVATGPGRMGGTTGHPRAAVTGACLACQVAWPLSAIGLALLAGRMPWAHHRAVLNHPSHHEGAGEGGNHVRPAASLPEERPLRPSARWPLVGPLATARPPAHVLGKLGCRPARHQGIQRRPAVCLARLGQQLRARLTSLQLPPY